MEDKKNTNMTASFSTLVMSIGSSALMALGLAPDPATNKTLKNLNMAEFNIELLLLLKSKTEGNLTPDEESFLNSMINDLQMKFIKARSPNENEV